MKGEETRFFTPTPLMNPNRHCGSWQSSPQREPEPTPTGFSWIYGGNNSLRTCSRLATSSQVRSVFSISRFC